MIFETHAHYDDEKFDADRVELLSSMKEKGISYIINVGASMEGTRASVALSQEYDFIFASVGVHPEEVYELSEEDYDELREISQNPKVVAIGEIGLDYHYIQMMDASPEEKERLKQKQMEAFRRQLDLALDVNLPVIIHSRDAAEPTMQVMTEYSQKGISAVIHCYSYSADQAKEYVRLGYYIGVGGVVTFKNGRKLQETVREIPMERILLETDSPYMAPEPHRGTRNDSAYIPLMVKKISELRGITEEEVEDITMENALTLFGKVKRWNT